ncbi:hypothetical protein I5R65_07685 [Herbaspirillum sp. AP02]|uniref:hypothetical protein n=1 Tax=unclassified Herbaspirillum TaxID=2624150 RepID=UPI0015D98F6F|nr:MULTISPECIES: hypothetical protein [unclassified Herbaspirillum]MBG7619341.1 hypothetical protein [Herbaspirillum sp. AP02]NZD66625.1 hypothetical protein [Herbaspirillum sp. AP21]
MQLTRRNWYVFMQEAGDGGGGAGGATGGEAGGADAGAGQGAGAGAAGDAGAGAASVLAAGAAAASGEAGGPDYIPEKLRVLKDDGSLDLEASSRKMAEAYTNAEKRIGAGDVRPKAAEEYTVTIPEAFKDAFKPEEDQGFQDFRTKAFEAGMTQKQLDLVMDRYFEMAPQLVAAAGVLDANTCKAELEKAWATPATFNRNVGLAFSAATALSSKAGIDVQQIMSGPLGNNPQFLQLMAALGPELAEDKNPNSEGNITSGDEVESLMASEAYSNSSHKDHARVSEKVRNYFAKKFGTEAAA